MHINWFPGHMAKALFEMQRQLKAVDVIIYVLDARAPLACLNPSLSKLSENKPVLFIFNKLDLADPDKLRRIAPRFAGPSTDYLLLNSTMSGSGAAIRQKLKTLAKAKVEKYAAKGIQMTIRAMVVGVPNCGKSTLVNNLCGKAKALTGDKPGVTKAKLWLNIGDNIELCDTPGTLYPNLADQTIAKRLLYIGSIKDEVVDTAELAGCLLDELQALYRQALQDRYKGATTLEAIAKVRGFYLSGGELDEERAAAAVLDDFRKGRIGRITFADC